jgi:hypothetical protein
VLGFGFLKTVLDCLVVAGVRLRAVFVKSLTPLYLLFEF